MCENEKVVLQFMIKSFDADNDSQWKKEEKKKKKVEKKRSSLCGSSYVNKI